jgi:hypothetical protein
MGGIKLGRPSLDRKWLSPKPWQAGFLEVRATKGEMAADGLCVVEPLDFIVYEVPLQGFSDSHFRSGLTPFFRL